MEVVVAVFASWLGLLLAAHVFGAAGRAIQETTGLIRYGRIVSVGDYLAGLPRVFPREIVARLDPRFIVRIAAFLSLAYGVFLNPRQPLSRGVAVTVLWVLTLGQLCAMTAPLWGVTCMIGSSDLGHGIDGELFGEDWFSWAASDLLFVSSLPFAIFLSRIHRAPSDGEQRPDRLLERHN